MKTVAITGASGFVGRNLLTRLSRADWRLIPLVRTRKNLTGEIAIGPIERASADLPKIDAFIHLAARTSIGRQASTQEREAMRLVNVQGTANAIELAQRAGAKHFIFLSSVKALGEGTPKGVAYSEASIPMPEDAYGCSKLEAEQIVRQQCERAAIYWTIVRPPLVYGPGMDGNFSALTKLVNLGIPLPFGATRNKRSMVYVGNLTDFLVYCLISSETQNRTFMLADEERCSTGELIARIAHAHRKRAALLPVPSMLFRFGLGLIGRQDIYSRLFGSLSVDSTQARKIGWHQPFTMNQALKQTFFGHDSSKRSP